MFDTLTAAQERNTALLQEVRDLKARLEKQDLLIKQLSWMINQR